MGSTKNCYERNSSEIIFPRIFALSVFDPMICELPVAPCCPVSCLTRPHHSITDHLHNLADPYLQCILVLFTQLVVWLRWLSKRLCRMSQRTFRGNCEERIRAGVFPTTFVVWHWIGTTHHQFVKGCGMATIYFRTLTPN